jgi:hypothetical protein
MRYIHSDTGWEPSQGNFICRAHVPIYLEADISRFRLAVLGVAVALLIGCRGSNQPAEGRQADFLQGIWEVTSVQRDGEPDPLQIGAQLHFTGDEVRFQPKVVQFVDGMS